MSASASSQSQALDLQPGSILGHEACGAVHEVGSKVTKFKKGDRVVPAFSISCGQFEFCQEGKFTLCDRTNPSNLFEFSLDISVGRILLEHTAG